MPGPQLVRVGRERLGFVRRLPRVEVIPGSSKASRRGEGGEMGGIARIERSDHRIWAKVSGAGGLEIMR